MSLSPDELAAGHRACQDIVRLKKSSGLLLYALLFFGLAVLATPIETLSFGHDLGSRLPGLAFWIFFVALHFYDREGLKNRAEIARVLLALLRTKYGVEQCAQIRGMRHITRRDLGETEGG